MLSSGSATALNSTSYSNDRNVEAEYGVDPASGGIFHSDSKRFACEHDQPSPFQVFYLLSFQIAILKIIFCLVMLLWFYHLNIENSIRKLAQLKQDLYYRHDDLKEMLDSNKDNLKLEAMKRIIGVRY